MSEHYNKRFGLRQKANHASKMRCNTLICVLENPKFLVNIGNVLRNIDSFGVSKLYVIDGHNVLPKRFDNTRIRKIQENDDKKEINQKELRRKKKAQKKTSDILNRVSSSAVRYTYIKRFETTSECFEYLKNSNYISFVTSPHLSEYTPNTTLLKGDYTQKKVAVWFGNETNGISDEAKQKADMCIQIETCGIVESLNLGNSTGIVLHYITNQRRIRGLEIRAKKQQRKQNKMINNNKIRPYINKRKRSNSI